MSNHLPVNQTRELLDQLKSTVREFAAGEEKLEREFRSETARVLKQFEAKAEAQAAALAAQLTEVTTAFETKKRGIESRQERWRTRITQAHESSKRHALERIDHQEGRKKYEAQKGLMDNERQRKESLKRNDAALAEFNQHLAENRAGFVRLEEMAQRAFRGYPEFAQRLAEPEEVAAPDLSPDEYQLLEQLREQQTQTEGQLKRFQKLLLPRLFKLLALWLWVPLIVLLLVAVVPALQSFGIRSVTYGHMGVALPVVLALVIGAYYFSQYKARPLAREIAGALETARRRHNACLEKAEHRHAQEIERIEAEARNRARALEDQWQAAVEKAAADRELWPQRIEAKWQRVSGRNEQTGQSKLARLNQAHAAETQRLQQSGKVQETKLASARDQQLEKLNTAHEADWKKLTTDWQSRIQPIYDTVRAAARAAEDSFPDWQSPAWENWSPPDRFVNAVKFGWLDVDVRQLAQALPADQRLALPGPTPLSVPLLLTYPQQGSVLFETTRAGSEAVIDALNNIIFRLLATSPPGKASFTIIDPVKLGQNFAGIMHLADYEDNLINNRIWTQTSQIEQRLADLNEHMEKVIQMYLRNEYPTIAEYNAQAGNIAEKYHFVVIADFPANFSDAAARRLLHIAASGARCGVYTLIHWDHRHDTPADFLPEDLRKSSVCLTQNRDQFVLAHPAIAGARVRLEPAPAPEFATGFLHRVGEACRGSSRVEVPFNQVAPAESELWAHDTTEELRVPIGRSGATKLQYLAIGKGTRQHALIAGKTGSGKSTLFHVIITNLARWCSPEQVEFYLVDFKKGVEFKCYVNRHLPHARVVAIESDREFGLSVLQRVDEELKRRGDQFRQLGVQDIAGYKRAGGADPIPRSLLIIDEFQEFFVEDDSISQAAAVLLDRIVRQGRAFGIHVLLGSQTLGGAYTLARTTIGQMVVRIALQCNEADAYLIMDENNAAPRLLSRPGEGIYNDMAGAFEGNSPFQTVWLPDDERDACLEQIRARADRAPTPYPGPIVFEGNAPAEVSENLELRTLLEADAIAPTEMGRLWLGAPNSIKGPTEAAFPPRSSRNLLIVGQRDEASLAIQSLGLIALAAQFPRGAARFIVFDSAPPGSPERAFIERILHIIPHDINLVPADDLARVMTALAEDLQGRIDGKSSKAPATFLFIQGLQHFKEFRQADDFSFSLDEDKAANPAAQLTQVISEGPAHGIHVIARLDTYNNVNRFLGRKALSEFEMRVLFQMSANDSASLCDDPKASMLGLHCALFYNEQEGRLETFRPYSLPGNDWLEAAGRNLERLLR